MFLFQKLVHIILKAVYNVAYFHCDILEHVFTQTKMQTKMAGMPWFPINKVSITLSTQKERVPNNVKCRELLSKVLETAMNINQRVEGGDLLEPCVGQAAPGHWDLQP